MSGCQDVPAELKEGDQIVWCAVPPYDYERGLYRLDTVARIEGRQVWLSDGTRVGAWDCFPSVEYLAEHVQLAQWLNEDEHLFLMWRDSGHPVVPVTEFVRRNRRAIVQRIEYVTQRPWVADER